MLTFQMPLYFFIGALCYLFPLQSSMIAVVCVAILLIRTRKH